MIIRFKEKIFQISFKKRFFPVSVVRIVRKFNGEPLKYSYIKGKRLEGKVALVTGGYKGIGFAIAKRLMQDGAKVIITGRSLSKLQSVVKEFPSNCIACMEWDISDCINCEDYYKKAEAFFGRIDILVNNAGVNQDGNGFQTFEKMTMQNLHYQNDINVIGTVKMCTIFNKMYETGTILNIVSNTAVRGARDAYWISKWALLSYTKGLARQFEEDAQGRLKKTINGICPGPTKTDMMFNEYTSIYSPNMSNKRMGLPEEIAELSFVQILSGLNGQNGEITVCDGGESLI